MNTTADSLVVTVFGSSRPTEAETAYTEARVLGSELALRGFAVCTGGYGGVMEAVSRGAKEAGGRTIGVTAEIFQARANAWVDEEIRVKTWQDRLFQLIRRGDAYVVCAGGTGTLAELAVVWEMVNKRVMPARPFVALGEFWRPVIEYVGAAESREGSARPQIGRTLIEIIATPHEAAEFIARKTVPPLTRNIGR